MLKVQTFADGFGIWHARVFDTDGPWGNGGEVRNLNREWTKIRRKAQQAIRKEILARQNGPIKPVRVEVEKVFDPTGTGLVFSVMFKEKV